jgi:membrane-associated phospholipid phosphatase
MAETALSAGALGGLRRFARAWGEDLRLALARGAARDPAPLRAGESLLTHAAFAALVLGTGLFALVGYHAGFDRLNDAGSALPPELWQWLTLFGDERVAFALGLLIARRHPRVFWSLVCAAVVAALYARGLKPLIDASRPPRVLDPDSFNLIGPAHKRKSFPSGHSTTAGVFFGVLICFAPALSSRLILLFLAVSAGVSRVALGVHWPVDVAFGLGGGMLAAWVGLRLAAKSPWGVYDASVHLALVTAAAIVTVGLWFDHGGYPAAAWPLRILCAAALGYFLLAYWILPGLRVLSRDKAPR